MSQLTLAAAVVGGRARPGRRRGDGEALADARDAERRIAEVGDGGAPVDGDHNTNHQAQCHRNSDMTAIREE